MLPRRPLKLFLRAPDPASVDPRLPPGVRSLAELPASIDGRLFPLGWPMSALSRRDRPCSP